MAMASSSPMIRPDVPPSQWPMSISRPVRAANRTVVLSVLKIMVFPSVVMTRFLVKQLLPKGPAAAAALRIPLFVVVLPVKGALVAVPVEEPCVLLPSPGPGGGQDAFYNLVEFASV